MILPHLSYCNIIWGNCPKYLLQRLYLLQKRAIRIITKSPYLAHTNILFKNLNILTIFDLNVYCVAIFMYQYFKNVLPEIFNNSFTHQYSINRYPTRHSNDLYLPKYHMIFLVPL